MEQLAGVQRSLSALLALPADRRTPKVMAIVRKLEKSEATLLQRARSLDHGAAVEGARRELAAQLAATGNELKATDAAGTALRQAAVASPSPDLAAASHDLDTHKSALAGKKGVLDDAIGLLGSPLHSVADPASGRPSDKKTPTSPREAPKAVEPSGTKRNSPPTKGTRTEPPPERRPATKPKTTTTTSAHTTKPAGSSSPKARSTSNQNPATDLRQQMTNYMNSMMRSEVQSAMRNMT